MAARKLVSSRVWQVSYSALVIWRAAAGTQTAWVNIAVAVNAEIAARTLPAERNKNEGPDPTLD